MSANDCSLPISNELLQCFPHFHNFISRTSVGFDKLIMIDNRHCTNVLCTVIFSLVFVSYGPSSYTLYKYTVKGDVLILLTILLSIY